ncbi:MAG: hypothetical protein INQ03_09020 [Candidatus Heimdallarchaeota archaeon]|nr:hypothetical protein [Candidatus Heimdallarchaeota archaeon]
MELQTKDFLSECLPIVNELHELGIISYHERNQVEELLERDMDKFPEFSYNNVNAEMEYVFSFLRLLCLNLIKLLRSFYSTDSTMTKNISQQQLYQSLRRMEYRSIPFIQEIQNNCK